MSEGFISRLFPEISPLGWAIHGSTAFVQGLAINAAFLAFPARTRGFIVGTIGVVGAMSKVNPARVAVLGAALLYLFRQRLVSSGGLSLLAGIWVAASALLPAILPMERSSEELQEETETDELLPYQHRREFAAMTYHAVLAWVLPYSDFVWIWIRGLSRLRAVCFWLCVFGLDIMATSPVYEVDLKRYFPELHYLSTLIFWELPAAAASTVWRGITRYTQTWLFGILFGSASGFQYRSLDRSRNQIRLLKILPARWPGDTLRAELVTTEAHKAPPYEAISYRWSVERQCPILLDSQVFLVFESMYFMLSQLRHSHARLVWIDSICINQQDQDEKGWQIQLMDQIYRGATMVVGWIQYQAKTSGAMRSLKRLAKAFEDEDEGLLMALIGRATHLGQYTNEWRAIIDFLCNEWFSRVWIIQEVALSRNLVLMHGDETLFWGDFLGAVGVLVNLGLSAALSASLKPTAQESSRLKRSINNAAVMAFARDRLSESAGGLLLSLILGVAVDFDASDAKDKIFGVLALTRPAARISPRLAVDYGKTLDEVLLDAAKFVLLDEDNIDSLELAGKGHPRTSRDFPRSLPSWVPDWLTSVESCVKLRSNFAGLGVVVSYSAAKHMALSLLEIDGVPDLLCTKGILFDKIGSLTSVWHDAGGSELRAKSQHMRETGKLLEQLDAGLALAKRAFSSVYSNEAADSLFWRTILPKRVTDDGTVTFDPQLEGVKEAIETTRAFVEQIQAQDAMGVAQNDVGWSALWTPSDQVDWMRFARAVTKLLAAFARLMHHRLCLTEKGYIGIVPGGCAVGDRICVLAGASMPFVVRTAETGGGGDNVTNEAEATIGEERYELQGACYVEGIMLGELQEMSLEPEQILLQ